MRILYGVCGEGMGHAMRSAVVAEHLVSRGHDLHFVSSGDAQKYLERRWPGRVSYAMGLKSVMRRNAVQPGLSLLANVAKQTLSPVLHAATWLSLGKTPDVVISDFDPWTARYATLRGVALVAVDNIHFMSHFGHPSSVVSSDRRAAAIMYPIVNSMVPKAKNYLVTSFVGATSSRPNATLHLPILRPSVFAAAPENAGTHVCVYFNAGSDHAAIARELNGLPDVPFRVYGGRVHGQQRNVTLLPFSEDAFLRDLASADAVIGGAGFTLMTEAIYLGKPMLAAPFGGQFEQILNANYLEHIGYGARARVLGQSEISAFLDRLPTYRENLRSFYHDGNEELLQAVESAIG